MEKQQTQKPVIVKNDVPAIEADNLYGERYGYDWVYEGSPSPLNPQQP